MSEGIKITRQQLYEEVWSTPMTRLAKKYGISDVALGKICKKLNVPKPGLGHWAKAEAGLIIERPSLPRASESDSVVIYPTPQRPPESPQEQQRRAELEARTKQFAETTVPDVIDHPHRLTKQTRSQFQDIERKLKSPPKHTPGEPYFGYMSRPYDQHGRYACSAKHGGFDVLISLKQVDRALRILDTLAKRLERERFQIRPNKEQTAVELLASQETFAISMKEGYRRRELTPEEFKKHKLEHGYSKTHEMEGSGKLILAIAGDEPGTSRSWSDGKQPLEAQLPEVIAECISLVPLQKQLREQRAKETKERQEREWKEAQERWRREEELRALEAIINEASRHRNITAATEYLEKVEAGLRDLPTPSEPALTWVARVRLKLSRLDPLPQRIEELNKMPAE